MKANTKECTTCAKVEEKREWERTGLGGEHTRKSKKKKIQQKTRRRPSEHKHSS